MLVTKARIPSFIVTLGTYWGFKGIALLFNGGNYISPESVQPPREFTFLGIASQTLNISNLIIISVIVVALAQIMMSQTPFGTWMKSVGSNEEAARTVGLNVSRLKVGAFVISGVLAALAGIMFAAWQDSIYPSSGEGFSLQAIAGVILGGIPFTGGRGTIVGAAIGALIIGVIDDLIVLLGLPALYEYIFVAIILVIAGLQARGGPFVK
jgi:ribose/xylose/arabinose/galactoside ABC-type transport system permease subunit